MRGRGVKRLFILVFIVRRGRRLGRGRLTDLGQRQRILGRGAYDSSEQPSMLLATHAGPRAERRTRYRLRAD